MPALNRKARKARKMLRRHIEAQLRKDPTWSMPGMEHFRCWPTHSRKVK